MRACRPLVCFALVSMAALPAAAQKPGWIQFHDAKTGLSFRYPPNLHIHRRDAQKFHLPNVETVVDLIGNTKLNPGTIVLRFLVKRGRTSPSVRTKRLQLLRRVCKKTSSMVVDGHKAVVCVSTGRAAVHWSVEILRPRECTILTLLGGADAYQAQPPPHNGEFPLLSIIHTVHFTVDE
ncbi:MAG: hypothetical protein P8Z30_00055 [Acidobacteriota bacterium]